MNSQCTCIPGYTFSSASNACVQQNSITCRPNYILVNNVCVCPSGYGVINNNCLFCPANSFVDSNGNCVCNQGYTLNPNTFTCDMQCFANAYMNSFGQCVCISGYYRQGNVCIAQQTCTGGQVLVNGQCVCPAPQVVDGIVGGCTFCNTAGRMISNGQCVCSQTYFPTQTGCSPCQANSAYNSAQNACVCNANYQLINGVCTPNQNCPFNSVWNPTAGQCICNAAGQHVINGFCQACPNNSGWNGTACVCNSGYTQQSNGQCQQNCVNATFNGVTCVCWSGYYLINGVCQQCDINSQYSSTQQTCICNDGYFGTFNQCSSCDGSCRTCSGAAANQCTSCTLGSPVNGVCSNTCGTGQFVNGSNQCQACIANCDRCFTATSCTACAAGFSRNSVNNGGTTVTTCDAPTPGASYAITLRGNVLGNGVIYQGVALNAMPTTAFDGTGACTICSTLFTVQVNSLFTGITVTQEFVANSLYWFVVTFSFTSASAVPTFEYTISLNQAHASHFTAQDMTQTLTGSFSASAFPTAAAPAISNFRSSPSVGGLTFGVQSLQPQGVPSSAISSIFGSNP